MRKRFLIIAAGYVFAIALIALYIQSGWNSSKETSATLAIVSGFAVMVLKYADLPLDWPTRDFLVYMSDFFVLETAAFYVLTVLGVDWKWIVWILYFLTVIAAGAIRHLNQKPWLLNIIGHFNTADGIKARLEAARALVREW